MQIFAILNWQADPVQTHTADSTQFKTQSLLILLKDLHVPSTNLSVFLIFSRFVVVVFFFHFLGSP